VNLFEILEGRRQELAEIVTALVEKPAVDYDCDSLRNANTIPAGGGLYLFSQKGAPLGEYLYAGKSAKLRKRIGYQHGRLKMPSDMLGMVMGELKLDEQQAKLWIRDNCLVQWFEVEPSRRRAFAEDYTIALLRPMWNHKMSQDSPRGCAPSTACPSCE
jgi:hypothetical protein